MEPGITTAIRMELKIDWSIDNFNDLELFAKVFNLAERIALSNEIFNAGILSFIEKYDLGKDRIISESDYIGFMKEEISEITGKRFAFAPVGISSLQINSPPKLSLSGSVMVIALALQILGTDYGVMSRNIENIQKMVLNQAAMVQLEILKKADDELDKLAKVILKYRKHIERMKQEIERNRN